MNKQCNFVVYKFLPRGFCYDAVYKYGSKNSTELKNLLEICDKTPFQHIIHKSDHLTFESAMFDADSRARKDKQFFSKNKKHCCVYSEKLK